MGCRHEAARQAISLVAFVFAIAAPAAIPSVPAMADDAVDCENAMTQSDMNACAAEDFTRADAALNAAYKKIVGRLGNSETRQALVAAQRAWIAFRDAECAFTASASSGGSIHPMLVAECRAALTEARTERFKEYLACEEGDLSCPVPPQ